MARVLVADDASFMRLVMKNILQKGGHEVVGEASNGVEAIELYQVHKPDIVTMDITMPEMDGIQALKEIRIKYPAANIIICSAMGQKQMVMEGIKSGAKDFIVKPFQADRVLESIEKYSVG